jgi:hypothetical protein
MLLHAEIALRRVLEIDPEIGPVVILIWIMRVQISIEPRDLVFTRLSERALLSGLAFVRRGNFARRLRRNLQRRRFARLSGGDSRSRAVSRLSLWDSQIPRIVGLRHYRG